MINDQKLLHKHEYLIKITPLCPSDRHQWPDAKPWSSLGAAEMNLSLAADNLGWCSFSSSTKSPAPACKLRLYPPVTWNQLSVCGGLTQGTAPVWAIVGSVGFYHLFFFLQGTCLLDPYHKIIRKVCEIKTFYQISFSLDLPKEKPCAAVESLQGERVSLPIAGTGVCLDRNS